MSAERTRPGRRPIRVYCTAVVLAVLVLGGLATSSDAGVATPAHGRLIASIYHDRGDGVRDLDLYSFELGDRNRINLTDRAFNQITPAWSPDGRRIAFHSLGRVRVMRADGSNERFVLFERRHRRYPVWPSWSPDGTRFVYAEQKLDAEGSIVSTAVRTARVDGSDRRTLARLEEWVYHPTWSPDGKTIAFFQCLNASPAPVYVNLDCKIHTVRPDGSHLGSPSDLVEPYDRFPSWTVDGWLLFTSDRACREAPSTETRCAGIYKMRSDGSDAQLLAVPGDWTGDGELDAFWRVEAAQSPSKALVLLSDSGESEVSCAADPSSAVCKPTLWLWDFETGDRRQVSDQALTEYFDWQPLCNVQGTPEDDVLRGSDGRDLICGLGGNDVIKALAGDDVIFGHGGKDRIVGGAGQDIVVGNSGRDRCDRDDKDHSRVC